MKDSHQFYRFHLALSSVFCASVGHIYGHPGTRAARIGTFCAVPCDLLIQTTAGSAGAVFLDWGDPTEQPPFDRARACSISVLMDSLPHFDRPGHKSPWSPQGRFTPQAGLTRIGGTPENRRALAGILKSEIRPLFLLHPPEYLTAEACHQLPCEIALYRALAKRSRNRPAYPPGISTAVESIGFLMRRCTARALPALKRPAGLSATLSNLPAVLFCSHVRTPPQKHRDCISSVHRIGIAPPRIHLGMPSIPQTPRSCVPPPHRLPPLCKSSIFAP